jgi:tRNA modification GTPase
MVTLFPAPHSYTGEDTVEISCHGGILVTERILGELFRLGARPAEAGEFTQRAFINGRLSLTEAEAIGTLLDAKSDEQLRLSSRASRSRLADKIADLEKRITEILSSIYARIDYPDEDLGDFTDDETVRELNTVKRDATLLADTYRTGKAISEGIKTVIFGKPNVGKSTLYNTILGEDRAIVTDIAGTTRDLLEETVPLGRVMLRLTDTAGIRDSKKIDAVEKIGISRTLEKMRSADLIIAMYDISRPYDDEDRIVEDVMRESTSTKICILNKSDRQKCPEFNEGHLCELFDEIINVSLENNPSEALNCLTDAVNKLFTDEKISVANDAVISSLRQHSSLSAAIGYINTAIDAYRIGLPADAASSDIELALGALGELSGRSVSEKITDSIFSRFCVGK